MDRNAGIEGASVIVLFDGSRGKSTGREMQDLRSPPANDNRVREAVKTVTVRKQLEKSGVAIKIKVPVTEFVGVAVSTRISEEGELTSAIELVHGDPELNYKVFEEVGNGSVVAEWQNWGKKLRLPLYIRAGDGSLLPYSQQVSGVSVGPHQERRKLMHDVNRRPRFLNRRAPGESAS